MNAFKRLFILISALILLTGAGVFLVARFYLEPYLKTALPQQFRKTTGGELKFDALSVRYLPLGIGLQNVDLKLPQPELTLRIPQASLSIGFLGFMSRKGVDVKVVIDQPVLTLLKLPKPQLTQNAEASAPSSAPHSPVGVDFTLRIRDGRFISQTPETKPMDVQHLNVELSGLDLRGPWDLKLKTDLRTNLAGSELALPIEVESQILRHGESIFQTPRTTVNLGGLPVTITGQADLKLGSHLWKIAANAQDLNQLHFLPSGRYKGAISLQADASKANEKALWQARGKLHLENVNGDVKYTQAGLKLEGGVALNSFIEFVYGETLQIPQLQVDANFNSLAVSYQNLFTKPMGTPLHFKVTGQSDSSTLNVSAMDFVFDQLKAHAHGLIPLTDKGSMQIQLSVPETELKGFERYVTLINKSSLSGSFRLEAQIQGSPLKPESLAVDVNPLELKNAQASLQFKNENIRAEGPLTANLKAILSARGTEITRGAIDGRLDATLLEIKSPNLRKSAHDVMKLTLNADNKASTLNFKKLQLLLPFGTLSAQGQVRDLQAPQLNIDFQTTPLDLARASAFLPSLQSYKLSGSASSKGHLGGNYDFKKGLLSPLTLKTSVKAHLPIYQYQSQAAPPAKAAVKEAPSKRAEPLLPNWPILRTARIDQDLTVETFQFKDLKISGLRWQGVLDKGVLSGHAQIANLFEGQIDANPKLSLIEVEPTTQLQSSFKNFNLGSALNWALPDWKNQVKGIASGQTQAVVPFPSRADFLTQLQSSGSFNIHQGRLSALKFQNLINEKLSQVPGLGQKASLKTDDVLAEISSRFELAKAKMTLTDFNMKTPQNDELKAQGWIGLDKQVDLTGTAYLASAQVSGAIREANADKSGRLVLPIHIQGSLTEPQLGFATETLQQLLKNTANREADKLKQKLQKEGERAAEKLKDKLKDQFKGFLGN